MRKLIVVLTIIFTLVTVDLITQPVRSFNSKGDTYKMTVGGEVYYYQVILLTINRGLSDHRAVLQKLIGEFDELLFFDNNGVYLLYTSDELKDYYIKASFTNTKNNNPDLIRCLIYTLMDTAVYDDNVLLVYFNDSQGENKLPNNYQKLRKIADKAWLLKRIG